MLVAGETKKTQKELLRFLSQLLGAAESSLNLAQLGSSDGHKKYRGLLLERPLFFWAVSPGLRRTFAVQYENQAATVEEIPDLPSYSVIVDSKQ